MRNWEDAIDEFVKLEKSIKESDRTDKEYFFFVMNKIYELTEETGDYEWGHILADGLMAKVMLGLGYEDGLNIFSHLRKWYA